MKTIVLALVVVVLLNAAGNAAPKPVTIHEGFEVSELSALKNWEVMNTDPYSVAL